MRSCRDRRCRDCGRLLCRRCVTLGYPRVPDWPDDRMQAPVLAPDEAWDGVAQQSVWNEPQVVLCADCRNAYTNARRDRFVRRYEHGLPPLSPDSVHDELAIHFSPKRLGGAPDPATVGHARWQEHQALWGVQHTEILRRLPILRERLRECGPALFAERFLADVDVFGITSETLKTGVFSKQEAYVTGWQMLGVDGRWLQPSKWSSGVSVGGSSTGRSPTQWRPFEPTQEQWPLGVDGILHFMLGVHPRVAEAQRPDAA